MQRQSPHDLINSRRARVQHCYTLQTKLPPWKVRRHIQAIVRYIFGFVWSEPSWKQGQKLRGLLVNNQVFPILYQLLQKALFRFLG